ncbi:hypothetical protein ZWY2020_060080 [Hordeum vulgare]|nr:hypothetical protein ZWY2020_060080 [Hordeum vulgare]
MDYIPGEAHRRLETSSCTVVSTPSMEEESYRLRTTALMLTATMPWDGIVADMVARAIEREPDFSCRDIDVVSCFSKDFILTLAERHQRDLVFERRAVVVACIQFNLRPWFPHPGGNKVWHFYCRVAIDRLPLNAWDWDTVHKVSGKDCELDLIER